MNQFAQFVLRVRAVARTNEEEAVQKLEIEELFRHFVSMFREAHSGEPREAERVHNDVCGLHDYLISEVNRHHAERLGALIEYAYSLVTQWMHKSTQA